FPTRALRLQSGALARRAGSGPTREGDGNADVPQGVRVRLAGVPTGRTAGAAEPCPGDRRPIGGARLRRAEQGRPEGVPCDLRPALDSDPLTPARLCVTFPPPSPECP